MENNETKNQIEILLKNISDNPQNADNYLHLGKTYLINHQYDSALIIYKNLLKIDPNNIQALINSGSIYFCKYKFKEAIQYYQKASTIDSSNYSIFYNLGNAYAELSEFQLSMNLSLIHI